MKKELTKIYTRMWEKMKAAGNILLVSHVNPDGDAIGSLLAMYLSLQAKGKNVHAVTPNDFPGFLKWLPGAGEIVHFQGNNALAVKYIRQADLIVMLDFNDESRLGKALPEFARSTAARLLIDHHPDPSVDAELTASCPEASSTAEMVYDWILAATDANLVSPEVATCIYTGIMTDTGCFSFNSSRPETFLTVAELLKTGIDKDGIFDRVYNNFSADRMKLLGYSLHQKMTVLPEYHTSFIVLSQEEQKSFSFSIGDSEGFVNYPLSIRGIIFSILLMEKKDHIKLSFRSKGNFSVNMFARKHFNGGGHENAAGGESYETLEKAVLTLQNLIPLYAEELEKAFTNF